MKMNLMIVNVYMGKKRYFCYPKKFTWKAFNKFSWEKQELLCERYNIILTDYRTPREKLKYYLDEYPKKIDKGLKVFDKYMKEFDKGMKQFSDGMSGLKNVGPTDKEIDKLLGK